MPISHLIFELVMFALTVLCGWHAWQRGSYLLSLLLVSTLFGILIEYVGLTMHSYVYGRFLVMLFPATYPLPLCIPLGWGVILYTAMQTSAYMGHMFWLLRPAINALLALSLDFVMDPVASGAGGMGMWQWHEPGTCLPNSLSFHCSHPGIDPIFGIPLSNFVGWYFTILSFSFFILLGWRLVPPGSKGWWVDLLLTAAAAPLALGVNLFWLQLFIHATQHNTEMLFAFTCVMLALLVTLWYAPFFRTDYPFDPILVSTPAFICTYFTFWLLVRRSEMAPGLLIFAPIMLLLGGILFLWPYRRWIAGRLPSLALVKPHTAGQAMRVDQG